MDPNENHTGLLWDTRSADARLIAAFERLRTLRPKAPLIGAGHPITSQAVAAALSRSDRMQHRAERLLHAVHQAGDRGVIDDELIVQFQHWPHSSVTATMAFLRRHELVRAGPDTRPTRYGNMALVNRMGA